MDPSLLPTPGPTIHSPSEASYSSAPSRTSTRSTSPDISSHRSSPLLDLHHLITTSNIVPETNRTTTLTDQQSSNMEKTTSVPAASDGLNNNPRRSGNKFNIDQRTGTSANYQQQPQAGLHPGAPIGPGNLASRSLTSNNWRAHPMTDGMYNSFDPANTQNHQQPQPQLQHHFGHPTSAHQQQQQLRSSLGHPYTANDNMVSPIFPDALLDACYAYGYDRGNGQYTRLIPADMIPSLCDVPALEQDCLGMILLPVPRALPANGRSSNVEPVMLKTPPPTPTSSSDNIQAHIDTIVGVSPRTPTHSHGANNSSSIASSTSTGGAASANLASSMDQQQSLPLRSHATNGQGMRQPMGSNSGGGGALGDLNSSMHAPANQHHSHGHGHGHGPHAGGSGGGVGHSHHHPHQQSQQQPQQFPQRRPKIYCDKWVHEGVCAFTQQGCKYKHEMPFDKLTQHQLGLFHGLPAWWKKHQAELARQRDPSDSEQDGHTGGRHVGGADITRGGGGGRGGGAALGDGHHLSHAGAAGTAGTAGSLAWRRQGPGFSSGHEEVHPGFGDHPMNSAPGRGSLGNNPAGHGLHMGQHPRGNPMAPHSPLAWSKSPFGPIAPPAPTGLVVSQSARGVISTNNPYASLSNIDESMSEESKGN
ncbi:MFS general substrate transporter [Apiospora arundinis]